MEMTNKKMNIKLNKLLILIAIVALKLILSGLFSSDYKDKMFIPFVDAFLSGENPYDYFYENSLKSSFPYFPLMLLIESMGGFFLKFINPDNIFFRNLIFKFPLLLFDILCFVTLFKLNVRFKYLTVFYFCSPIILYSTYVHSQLDIIPTALFTLSLRFLLDWKKDHNIFLYALFLGLAISCKAHIVAAVPILFFYVAKKKDYLVALKTLIITIAIVFLITIKFMGNGFINIVLLNKEQTALTSVSINYGEMSSLFIPIAILVIVYLNAYELNYFNKTLLISILGFLYTLFLICIPPMPAWFIWIVPFYALYFCFIIKDKYNQILIYASFNFIYLIYFCFFHVTDNTDIIFMGKSLQRMKIDDYTVQSIVFSMMFAFLCIISYKMFRFGMASNNLYRRGSTSFSIGIAGDSGAGKSKLLDKIKHLFGSEKDILFIEGDGDHRWARNDENWAQYTSLNPNANFLYRQAEDIKRLKNGNYVYRTEYDHDTGFFSEQRKVNTNKYIVLCGLHSLYLPKLRDELDLKIFMDTNNVLRNYWKIQRDINMRGYSKEQVVEQINKRLHDAEKYIYPQKQYADIVITYFDKTLYDCYAENHHEEISVKFEVSINIDMEGLIKSFELYGVYPSHRICDDLYHQEVIFDGKEILRDIDFEKIAEITIPQYDDLFTYYPKWGTNVEGVVQIILLYLISGKMKV